VKSSRFPGLLTVAMLGACASVVTTPAPAPTAGDRIRYAGRPDTADLVPARLISLDGDSLVFERFVPGEPGRWIAGALATDSVARLQVRVGRRRHAGMGALIGGAVGAAVGLACAAEEGDDFVSPEQCFAGFTVMGAGAGLLIGLLVRTDVWAPARLPSGAERSGAGLRIPR
jgi:hypothetical protein